MFFLATLAELMSQVGEGKMGLRLAVPDGSCKLTIPSSFGRSGMTQGEEYRARSEGQGGVSRGQEAKIQDIPGRREIQIIKDTTIISRGYNFSSRNEKKSN